MKIKTVSLENYKGVENFKANLSDRTMISGMNASGKTTVANAILDVLTGRDFSGKAVIDVIPHDSNGIDIDHLRTVREIVMEHEGKETTLTKVTEQRWRTPHGCTEPVLDGISNVLMVDGFIEKTTGFADAVNKVCSADTMLACMNASYFTELAKKSTVEARKFLAKISGYSDDVFIAEHPQYKDVEKLLAGHDIDKVLKKLNSDRLREDKECKRQQTIIQAEKSKTSSDYVGIDVVALSQRKSELSELIAKTDVEIAKAEETYKKYSSYADEVFAVKEKISKLVAEEETKLSQKKRKIADEISSARIAIGKLNIDADQISFDKRMNASIMKNTTDGIAKYEADLESAKALEFVAEPLEMCKYSKASCEHLEKHYEKVNKIKKAEFEDSKGAKVAELENRIKNEREHLETLCGKEEIFKEELRAKKAEITKAEKALKTKEEKLKAMPTYPDVDSNKKYMELKSKLAEINTKRAEIKNCVAIGKQYSTLKETYVKEVAEIDAKIETAKYLEVKHEETVKEQENAFREAGQRVADIERQIDTLKAYSMEKNNAMAFAVNKYFDVFHFQFLDYTLDGNPVEVCKIIYNDDGSNYFTCLNHGARIRTEADMLHGFQEMNGVKLPIILDDTESVDSDKIPVYDTQMIILRRTDEPITVKEI